jgi:hypothetical protein
MQACRKHTSLLVLSRVSRWFFVRPVLTSRRSQVRVLHCPPPKPPRKGKPTHGDKFAKECGFLDYDLRVTKRKQERGGHVGFSTGSQAISLPCAATQKRRIRVDLVRRQSPRCSKGVSETPTAQEIAFYVYAVVDGSGTLQDNSGRPWGNHRRALFRDPAGHIRVGTYRSLSLVYKRTTGKK